jgi:hypothetical protein
MSVEPAVKKVITHELKQIETEYGLSILMAVESGSRAWGFPSRDSDYDVRFVYIWPLEDYLSISPPRETLNFAIKNNLDLSGWDLRKVLRHIRKSNAVMFEWFQSPVLYTQRTEFSPKILKLAQPFFSPRAALHHYLGLLHKFYPVLEDGGEVKFKKLFYILRPLLAASWIIRLESLPPMAFRALLDPGDEQAAIFPLIRELMAEKARGDENSLVLPPEELHRFIDRRRAECEAGQEQMHTVQVPEQGLNDFFLKVLEKIKAGYDSE